MSNVAEQLQMIEDCEERESLLSEREIRFIDDIGQQLRRGKYLTLRQRNWLEQIWERVTDAMPRPDR